MERSIVRSTVLTIILAVLCACQVQPQATAGQAITSAPTGPVVTLSVLPTQIILADGLGRQVTLGSPAQKIVSLAASNTEILFAVGAGSQVIGRDNFSDFPQQAQTIPGVGDVTGFNREVIVNLEPDLVLAAEINSPEEVKALEDLGLTVYYLPNPKDLEGLYANLNTVGVLTGHQVEAAELAQALMLRIESVQKAVTGATGTPSVFYELDGTDPTKPWTSGPGTFIDKWISMAGGRNIGASLSGEWAQLSQEEIIFQNPDIIVLGDSIYGVTAEAVSARPGWDSIRAVKEGRVYPFDDDLVSRPGPRLVDGLVELAKIIHPEISADLK